MKLTVFSHKLCWPSEESPTGYATSGGFPFQMEAITSLFESARIVVPVVPERQKTGEIAIVGEHVDVIPLTHPQGEGLRRKLAMLPWLALNGPRIWREVRQADAVHVPIPSDVGTFGMVLAHLMGKPLFVRHCGNWSDLSTRAKRFWRWFMERTAGGQNVMLATGGAPTAPSEKNDAIDWIFSTSLTREDLERLHTVRQRPEPASARLITVSRQEQYKGTHLVIKAVAALLTDYPHIHLDVVGDGTALDDFRELADRLGVANHVTFWGRLPHEEVIQRLQLADIFCYPTMASEGFPKVVLEALACGLPVITTDVSVLPHLIEDCAGVIVRQDNIEDVIAAVRHILADDDTYQAKSDCAVTRAGRYSLEEWRATIGKALAQAWEM